MAGTSPTVLVTDIDKIFMTCVHRLVHFLPAWHVRILTQQQSSLELEQLLLEWLDLELELDQSLDLLLLDMPGGYCVEKNI